MTFLTSIALRRPTVALLAIIIVLTSGVLAYRSMQVELFPQIEFPLVVVFATYPSADPGRRGARCHRANRAGNRRR